MSSSLCSTGELCIAPDSVELTYDSMGIGNGESHIWTGVLRHPTLCRTLSMACSGGSVEVVTPGCVCWCLVVQVQPHSILTEPPLTMVLVTIMLGFLFDTDF